jgi:hemolysin activation/secretion protein
MKSLRIRQLAGMACASVCCTAAPAPPQVEAAQAQVQAPIDFPALISLDVASFQRQPAELPRTPSSNQTLRLAATLTQSLPRDWLVAASFSTQYSADDVSQQDIIAPSVSSTLTLNSKRDVLKDGGFAGTLELFSPNLCATWLRTCRAVMFYDRNYVKYNRDIAGQLRSGSVASVGVGVRLQLRKRMNLQLDAGRVTRSSLMPDDARARVSLRLGYSF